MTMTKKILALLSLGVFACGKDDKKKDKSPSIVSGPAITNIPEADRDEFDRIFGLPADDVFAAQVKFLKSQKHDLKWFTTLYGDIVAHDTVQVIYFGATDYVIGWCSGAFIASQNIATAGHCHASFDLEAGESCRGKVLFAIKESSGKDVDYYECNELTKTKFVKSGVFNDGAALLDYATFSLRNARPVTRAYDTSIYSVLSDLRSSSKEFTDENKDKKTVGLVVDPPSSYENMSSSYDIVHGKMLDRVFRGDATYLANDLGKTQPGNSGGPFYRVNEQGFDSLKSEVNVQHLSYIAPLYGYAYGDDQNGTYREVTVLSNPAQIFENFPW